MAVPNTVPNKEAFVCSRFSQGTVVGLFDMMVEGTQKTKFIAMSNIFRDGRGVVHGEAYLSFFRSAFFHGGKGRKSVGTLLQ